MHTEDARRIILRAANAGPRSPQKGGKGPSGGNQVPHIINIAGSRVSASAAAPASTSPPTMNLTMPQINQLQAHNHVTVPLPPLTSNGSSGSSSGHSSMSGCTAVPPISSSSSNDMATEVTSNPHLRLMPSSSPSSPSSSATSSPSSRLSNHQQNIYFRVPHPPVCSNERSTTNVNQQHRNRYNKTTAVPNGYEGLYNKVKCCLHPVCFLQGHIFASVWHMLVGR